MNLKKKILIGYGVSVILMTLVVAWSVMNLVSLGKASDAILRENYRSIQAAENMIDVLERQDSAILAIFLGDRTVGVRSFRDLEATFYEWLAREKDNITIEGEAELVKSIEEQYSRYRRIFFTAIGVSGEEKSPMNQSLASYKEHIFPVFLQIRTDLTNLRQLNETTMYSASMKAAEVADRAIWSTSIVALSALVVALAFSLILAERIVHPLKDIMEAARTVSAGSYTAEISVNTRDELGNLASEFNQMVSRLRVYHEMNIDEIVSEKNKSLAILSSIEDGLVVFDRDLRITAINPAARKMLELEIADYSTLSFDEIGSLAGLGGMIGETIRTEALPSVPEEQRIITRNDDGTSHQYLYSVTVIRGRDRKISGIVLLLKDITGLRELERLKSEFVTAASHELRTPLTSIGMSVDLLLDNSLSRLPEREQDLLRTAYDEIQRMKALVNDLLDLSKIETGRIELQFEKVEIRRIFGAVGDVFRGQVNVKNVELSFDVPNHLPEVRADSNKITWVLTNLVSNAIRYLGDAGYVRLTASRIGAFLHVSVKDNGPGVPEEFQEKIFQKFVQVKGREGGGTGLGLAICKEIIRAHGGTIWVESRPGKGSSFTFTLPLAVKET